MKVTTHYDIIQELTTLKEKTLHIAAHLTAICNRGCPCYQTAPIPNLSKPVSSVKPLLVLIKP